MRTFLPRSPRSVAAYARQDAWKDASAGLTVAVMGVPQAMAYAMIAGLNPALGLYTAIVPCLTAAVFGSSRHLVTGPTNAMSMVIFSLTAALPQRHTVGATEVVLLLTLLTSVFQLTFGILRLGKVVKYVSHSVVVGFTAGAGVLIAVNQLRNLIEVKLPSDQAGHFAGTLWATLARLPETNFHALFIGLLVIATVTLGRRVAPRLPGALIAIVAATLLAYQAGWIDGPCTGASIKVVRDIQEVTSSLDLFHMPQLLLQPDWGLTRDLAAGALALAILGLVESASIARSIATKSGQRLDFNREFTAQGAANLVGAFCSSFPAAGSFTRSAVCYQSGGRTRAAAALSAVFTALVVLLFGPLANYIPQAALAGILMVVAYSMVDREKLALTWNSGRNSRVVMAGTLAATLLLPLEMAVFAGVGLSILILLRITAKPDLTQLVQHPESGFEEVPFNRAAPDAVAIVNLEGDLYFAAADDLDYELLTVLRPETRVVVLRLKRLRAVGSSAMAMLEHFHELLDRRGVRLVLCGVERDLKKILRASGVLEAIGEENIFYADNRILQSTELATARARDLARATSPGQPKAPSRSPGTETITVADLMQRRGLRFGNEHQLREAMWLISQFQRRMTTDHPQTVFLQDSRGRLSASLSAGAILRHLAEAVPTEQSATLDDKALEALLEKSLYQSVTSVATPAPPSISKHMPAEEALDRAAANSYRPLAVCDDDGRLQGVFDEVAMLRAASARHPGNRAKNEVCTT